MHDASVALTEPVVLHRGRADGGCRLQPRSAVCCNSLLAGVASGGEATKSFLEIILQLLQAPEEDDWVVL